MKKSLANSKVAVIDCGTNTFKLLIAKIINDRWYPIYESTIPVKLTPPSNTRGLSPERMARALDVLSTFKENIINFEVDQTLAYATSAVRSAPNGIFFVEKVKESTGINIEIIDGDREAMLIFKGVSQSIELTKKPVLIMDIGGGSTEFILANSEGIFWKQSFQLGSSRLFNKFSPSSPMTAEDLETLNRYFEKTLEPLFKKTASYQPQILIGNSGSFNSIVSIINHNYSAYNLTEKNNKISLPLFFDVHESLCKKTKEEKLNILGLKPMRAEIITLATTLTAHVLKKSQIKTLIQTSFSLKEGVIKEIMVQDLIV